MTPVHYLLGKGKLMRVTRALVLLGLLLLSGCRRDSPSPPQSPPTSPHATPRAQQVPSAQRPATEAVTSTRDDSHLLLGNPSDAQEKAPDNLLLARPQHVISYNRSQGGPNWVAWHLDERDLGDTNRSSFRPDPLLPPSWQIRPSDYKGSGYDRGHVSPSGDHTRTEADNEATFVMSNMLPQAPALNQHVWKDLEDQCRDWAREGKELYIIAGGVGSQGRIGNGKINVPEACWKIVVVLPRGKGDLGRINARTPVYAVLMPNRDEKKISSSAWNEHAVSIDRLEQFTGYDFLSSVPDDIEKALERKVQS